MEEGEAESECVCVLVLSSSELQCRQIATLKKLTAKFVCFSLFSSLSLACALSCARSLNVFD